jgi:hypothetical protein
MDVENELHRMGGGREHAAGFSQSQHNCDEWPCDDDDDDENITFAARQAPAEGTYAYSETMLYK